MSTDHAIITVTRTLRRILADHVASSMGVANDVTQGFDVTTLPPHKVRDVHKTENIINLFLYRTEINAAWRNMPLPSQAKPGETATPPLALNLEYLVTAYGEGENEDLAHFFLGGAMRVLHDCSIVPRGSLASEVEGKGEVHQQIENVRVTPRPLSIEEMSKLWSIFQTQYRVSASYLVTVLLIESRVPIKSGPPVLKRGPEDRGVTTVTTPPPVLTLAKAESGFAAPRLAERVILLGEHLEDGAAVARLHHPRLAGPIEHPATLVDAATATIDLPDPAAVAGTAAGWPAGVYSVSLVVTRPNQPKWTTNEVTMPLAPRITITAPAGPIASPFELTLEAMPQIRDGQSVAVVWDDQQVAPKSVTTPANDDDPTEIKADLSGAQGTHLVRLRVDGVDSIPIQVVNGAFVFDDAQRVQVL